MSPSSEKTSPNAGWILVTGVMLLCVVGTWLTVHNYKSQVFSSGEGTVLENQWPESRISVELPQQEASRIKPGHGAKITVGNDPHLLQGAVVSVTRGNTVSTVIIKLTGDSSATSGDAGKGNGGTANQPPPYLSPGTKCSVTIDTTIPPQEDPPAR
jgi:hypothetical protein